MMMRLSIVKSSSLLLLRRMSQRRFVSDFKDTGFHEDVVRAIRNAGFEAPLRAQGLTMPRMIMKDARVPHRVVASETGSGKTLTYLSSISHDFKTSSSDEGEAALVLCPNQTLCDQVHRTAKSLVDDDEPLLVPEILSGTNAPRSDIHGDNTIYSRTNLYISTPGSLINHMENFMDRGRQRHFVRNLRHLVLDEADSLLTRGYEMTLRKVFVFLAYGDVFRKGVDNSDRKDLAKFIRRMMWRHEKNELLSGKTPRIFFVGATMPSRGKKSAGGIVKRVFSESADWIDESPMLHRALENLKFQWKELPVHPKQRRKFESSEDAASYRGSIRDWEVKFHSNVADAAVGGVEDCSSEQRSSSSSGSPNVTVVFCRTVRRANEVAAEIRRRVESDEENKVAVTAIHKGVDESERVSYLEWLSDSETASSRASKELDPEGTSGVGCFCTTPQS